jgi:hypothetical protein
MRPSWVIVAALLAGIFGFVAEAFGGWVPDGAMVCYAAHQQQNPEIVSDGAGGAFIVWDDYRAVADLDIYAQYLDAMGRIRWTFNGVRACGEDQDQWHPQVVLDGSGGIIVAWEDERNGNWDIYAQRLDAAGDPVWALGGVPVCDHEANQYDFQMVSDEAGGAILAWEDERGFFINHSLELYAQRLDADGLQWWPHDGLTVSADTSSQQDIQMIPDGGGGAILVWSDRRNDPTLGWGYDVYGCRIRRSGAFAWKGPVVELAQTQYQPSLGSDGELGAYVAWTDNRLVIADNDLWVQRVDSVGVRQWGLVGVRLVTEAGTQHSPRFVSDGSGGAIVVWLDGRGADQDLYAQKLLPDSTRAWTAGGELVCGAITHQRGHEVVPDGSGGAIVVWYDDRAATMGFNIYAQRIDATGKTMWDATGLAICSYGQDQDFPCATTNGAGGVITAWVDDRNGLDDIYAQMATYDGEFVPTLLQSYSARWRDGVVAIEWRLSEIAYGAVFTILRSHGAGSQYRPIANPNISGEGSTRRFVDDSCERGIAYRYRVDVEDGDGPRTLFETEAIHIPATALELYQNHPNPFNPSTTIRFYLPERAQVSLDVYDPQGRRVATLLDDLRPAGWNELEWDAVDRLGNRLHSGVYMYRLQAGKHILTRKMTVLK